MAYIINIGLPTLWVTLQLWIVYFVVHIIRAAPVDVDATERMLRFGVTAMGVLAWLYIVASALTSYTPLVALFAPLLGTALPMWYVANEKKTLANTEYEEEEDEAPGN